MAGKTDETLATDVGMKRDPAVLNGIVVGVLSLLLLLVILLGLETLYHRTAAAEERRKAVEPPATAAVELEARQRELLEGYRVVDEAAGVVAIPIEEAMRLVVADPQRLAAPAPAPVPGPAAGGERRPPSAERAP